jgi:hypothetical protein
VKLLVDTSYFLKDASADGNGNFTQDVTLPPPSSPPPGATFIKAEGEISTRTTTTPITIY